MGGLFGPIGAGVLHSISENLNDSHKEQLAQQAAEEESAKSVYKSLLSSDSDEARALGLAGLASVNDPKERKKALANALKFANSVKAFPKHKDAERVVASVKPGGVPPPTPDTPAPPATSPPPTAPDINSDFSGQQAAQADISAPPAPPPQMSAALPASSPTTGGAVTSAPAAAAATAMPSAPTPSPAPGPSAISAPPSMEDALSDYGRLHSPAEVNLRRADLTKRDLASEANTNRLKIAEEKIAAHVSASSTPYMLSGVEAELAGVPDGTVVNPKLFTALHRDKGLELNTALRAAVQREGISAANTRSTNQLEERKTHPVLFKDYDPGTGEKTTQYVPRGEAAGRIGHEGPTTMSRTLGDRSQVFVESADNIIDQLKNNQELRDRLGRISGTISSIEQLAKVADPVIQKFAGEIMSMSSAAGAVHGYRSSKVGEEMVKKGLQNEFSPDSMAAYLEGVKQLPQRNVDLVHRKPAGDGSSSAPPPLPPAAMREVGKSYTMPDGKKAKWLGPGKGFE